MFQVKNIAQRKTILPRIVNGSDRLTDEVKKELQSVERFSFTIDI